jgi:sugar phosphate isomerase/epimerase
MNPGIVADEIHRDFSEAVRVGVPLGLRCYEIRFLTTGRAPLCDRHELVGVERLARDEGLEITALSPGLFKYVTDEAGFNRDLDEVYPRAAEWAHRWKLPGLIVFGFQKPGATEENGDIVSSRHAPPQVVDWLARAGERAQADGLTLMIEPEPICWADSNAGTAALIRRASVSSLRINYDPGNVAWLERRDPIDEFEAAAPWIANVHVKDVEAGAVGSGKPRFLPAGEGIIDYRVHFAALRRIGYRGPISLEPHMDGSPETIGKCLRAFERQWEAASAAV